MFGWFKKKNVIVVPEVSKEDILKESIEKNLQTLRYEHRKHLINIKLNDTRFKTSSNENGYIRFYIVNDAGETKNIAGFGWKWEYLSFYNSGIWDNAFNSVLVDLIEKCEVLKIQTEEIERKEKQIREESFTKFFKEN